MEDHPLHLWFILYHFLTEVGCAVVDATLTNEMGSIFCLISAECALIRYIHLCKNICLQIILNRWRLRLNSVRVVQIMNYKLAAGHLPGRGFVEALQLRRATDSLIDLPEGPGTSPGCMFQLQNVENEQPCHSSEYIFWWNRKIIFAEMYNNQLFALISCWRWIDTHSSYLFDNPMMASCPMMLLIF